MANIALHIKSSLFVTEFWCRLFFSFCQWWLDTVRKACLGELSVRAQLQQTFVLCGSHGMTNFNFEKAENRYIFGNLFDYFSPATVFLHRLTEALFIWSRVPETTLPPSYPGRANFSLISLKN